MADYSKNNAEENTFIKAYEDFEKSKTPIRGPEAFPLLEIIQGPKKGTWFTVAYQKEITLGRAATNSIILEDNSVSRSHSVLESDGEKYTIRDIGSRNGTFLNGKKIQGAIDLKHRDEIKIGIYTLRFLEEPVEEEVPEPVEAKEEHTPIIDEAPAAAPPSAEELEAEMPPQETEAEAALSEQEVPESESEAEEPPAPEAAPEEKIGERTLAEDLDKIAAEEEGMAVHPAEQEGRRPIRNLLILMLIILVLGGGGFLAYRLGAFHKIKAYLGTGDSTKVSQKADKKETQKPKVLKPEQPKAPEGKVIPVFLEVNAKPIGGKIFYQGKELGVTPFKVSLQVPAGKAQEVSGEFYLPALDQKISEKQTFEVSSKDQVVTVNFDLKLGSLKVKALPKEGQLYLESILGKDKSKSIKLSDIAFDEAIHLPYGKYVAEIRVPEKLSGSQSEVNPVRYRREFSLDENSPEYSIEASRETLNSFPAKILTQPEGAELLIDGKKMGETPYEGPLPTGRHQMVLKKEGFNDLDRELAIDLNVPYEATFNLKTTPAGEFINQGRAFLKKGMPNEAIEKLAEALKKQPSTTEIAHIHFLLGEAFLGAKTYDQALAYYQRAQDNPAYAKRAKLGMAEAHSGLGDKSQALIQVIDVFVNTQDEQIRSDAEGVYQRISPMKSVLYVATQPEGAQVTVNGNPIGQTTPVILSDLLVGSYRVGIKKPGFKDYETRVTLPIASIKPVLVKLDAEP